MRHNGTLNQSTLDAFTHFICLVTQTATVEEVVLMFSFRQWPRLLYTVDVHEIGSAPKVLKLQQEVLEFLLSKILDERSVKSYSYGAFGSLNHSLINQFACCTGFDRSEGIVRVSQRCFHGHIDSFRIKCTGSLYLFRWLLENPLTNLIQCTVQRFNMGL